jgi:hypothetical protein
LPVGAVADTLNPVGPSRAAFSARARSVRSCACRLAAAGGVCLWLAAPAARAQGDDPRAIAEALFRSGRELMAAGDLSEACAKFAESNRIDPKPGTLMNLALCHEKAGRTASAWAEYVQAAEISRRAGQDERERVANERAHSLEATLPHLVIDSSAGPDAAITLDDQPIGAGAFGTPIPVDPGEHVVAATAPGKDAFHETVTAAPIPELVTVHVPALSTTWSAPPVSSVRRDDPRRAPPTNDGASARRTWGFIAGGAGAALIGIGSYFGIRAFDEKHVADNACGGMYCTQSGHDAISAMKTAEAVSTISIAAGVVGVGVGLYLVLSPPRTATARAGGASAPSTPSILRVGPDAAIHGVRAVWTW